MAASAFLCPPGTKQTAPRISKAATLVLMFSQRRLWATVEMPVGWAKTCARPFWKYTKINKNPQKKMNYPTELFMSALRQPMRVVCSGLCLVSWSRLPRKSSKASRPPCSTNLRTKLCGCVLSAVFKASICLVLALNSSSSPVKDNWKKTRIWVN